MIWRHLCYIIVYQVQKKNNTYFSLASLLDSLWCLGGQSQENSIYTPFVYTYVHALGSFYSSGFLYDIFSDVFGFNSLSSQSLLLPALPFPTQFNSSCSIVTFSTFISPIFYFHFFEASTMAST